MVDFTNTEVAFSLKSNGDLRTSKIIFKTIESPRFVKFGKFMANVAMAIHFPIRWAVKPTLYKHFVGGETLEGCEKTMQDLHSFNISCVLDYSAEGGNTHKDVMNAYEETIRAIDFTAKNKYVAYAVFKPTAMIVGASLLEKAAENYAAMTDEEKEELRLWEERMKTLCRRAYEHNIRIIVDAEEFVYNHLIDNIVIDLMQELNKERAIVFITLQMYRWDRNDFLKDLHNRAKEKGFIPGIKFVRGAYMEDERKRAKEKGYKDPINSTKEDTDNSYNSGVKYVIENINDFELFIGSHNEKSNQDAASLLHENGIKNDDHRIFFAQLYGMSDHISFNLAKAGYNVCKYLPYAPVNKVLPYLIRRAEENTSIAGQTGRELALINTELKRRKTSN